MLWTVFTIGALGSFHCIGMCGPIALALPLPDHSYVGKISGSLVYNFGRIFTYAVLGAIFGLLGQGFVMAGFQQTLSIVLGVIILLSVLLPAALTKRLNPSGQLSMGIGKLKSSMVALFKKRSYPSLLMIGTLNGLLPCGLVYLGIAGAIASSQAVSGAAYMALFGLGTLPVMLVMSLAGNFINVNIRNKIRRALPVVVAIIGILFILRGLNLGIPYVSPQMGNTGGEVHSCH